MSLKSTKRLFTTSAYDNIDHTRVLQLPRDHSMVREYPYSNTQQKTTRQRQEELPVFAAMLSQKHPFHQSPKNMPL